ncbi:hypothetical protein [Floridanema aerugineum]|uniref:hypothetical protein n=1 Tax=Floridanema aerugineum TaxID=3396169 RepID=UPI0039A5B447
MEILYSEREFMGIIFSSQSDRTITVDGYSDYSSYLATVSTELRYFTALLVVWESVE